MPHLQIFLSEDNQTSHDLGEEKVTVGRLADNTLQIEDASVSSHHAEVFLESGKYHLLDLGSTNGTFVNGEAVTAAILNHGDEVRFGRIETVFSSEEEGAESQPLPDSATAAVTVTVASLSARPENFVSSSPVSRSEKKTDPVAYAVYALAGLALIAAGAAAYFVTTLPSAV